jgi:hypothetical protein
MLANGWRRRWKIEDVRWRMGDGKAGVLNNYGQ